MSRTKTLKITRHPEVVTMYRVVQGDDVLVDNLETLDDALYWQRMCWWSYRPAGYYFKNPNE